MSTEDVVKTLIEVRLPKEENFSIVVETLTRIGMKVKDGDVNRLLQSCHILHKRNKYYICHFKELYALDGRPSTFSIEDAARRNWIVNLLESWKLVTVVNEDMANNPEPRDYGLTVIKHLDKVNYHLTPKYTIGKKSAKHGQPHHRDYA
jgi:hypothetical protein